MELVPCLYKRSVVMIDEKLFAKIEDLVNQTKELRVDEAVRYIKNNFGDSNYLWKMLCLITVCIIIEI
ncbi:hypothetical protein [Thomasclavelia cocleata]|nr:hypothetical protein [Thomasclavelia cocleata]NDO42562.1 hypothetical protein [Thomasclavelia cocleata]